MLPRVCKKVTTFHKGKVNGSLMELFKDGDKTVVYLTTIVPGGFKGYHLHKVRKSRYACLKGSLVVTMAKGDTIRYQELKAGESMEIGTDIFIGLDNKGTEEVWLINYPDPPYDPNLKDEQIDKDHL